MMGMWFDLGALILAFGLDLLLGDPRCLPHPVRAIGGAVLILERLARRLFHSASGLRFAGGVIVFLVAGGCAAAAFYALKYAFYLHFLPGMLLSIYLYYAMIAAGDMLRHVRAVEAALAGDNLPLARERAGLLVSRDTAGLDEEGVVRAALESLFENAADGVVAPLFYAALGGPALAVLYKAVNTMDSMLGYRTPRYFYLGWAAARADDLLSYIPARLTALLFILAGVLGRLNWKQGWRTLLQDRMKHDSPNSAWPEAAAAGVLGIRLGGCDRYHGKEISRPLLNSTGRPPCRRDFAPALALFKGVSLLALLAALVLMMMVLWWGAIPWFA
ncbi:MAG: cobalamin biosynthesis protein CobD [Firmicutes bacterium]|nr:cobalamin biosynthesis protein CobD [Bacillota bacterium]